jgi:hypothetical protein
MICWSTSVGANDCLKSNTELAIAVSVLALDHFLMLTNLS